MTQFCPNTGHERVTGVYLSFSRDTPGISRHPYAEGGPFAVYQVRDMIRHLYTSVKVQTA